MKVKLILARLIGMYYRLRSGGRVRGSRFVMTHTSLLRVRSGGSVDIGDMTLVGPQARIVAHDRLVIGDNVFIGKNSTLVAFSPLHIGEGTLFGENVSIHTENHGPAGRRQEFSSAPIFIGSDVWLGAGVVVTGGVSIGDGATVGANAVVLRDIPAGAVAVGVPARVVKGRRTSDDAKRASGPDDE